MNKLKEKSYYISGLYNGYMRTGTHSHSLGTIQKKLNLNNGKVLK